MVPGRCCHDQKPMTAPTHNKSTPLRIASGQSMLRRCSMRAPNARGVVIKGVLRYEIDGGGSSLKVGGNSSPGSRIGDDGNDGCGVGIGACVGAKEIGGSALASSSGVGLDTSSMAISPVPFGPDA